MKKLSLKYRMMLYSTIMVIVVVSLLASILLHYHNRAVREEFDLRTKTITYNLSHNLRLAVMLEDMHTIERILSDAVELPDILSLKVFDRDKELIADRGGILLSTEFLHVVSVDIIIEPAEISAEMLEESIEMKEPEKIGIVEIVFSTLRLDRKIMQMIKIVVFFTFIIIALRVMSDYFFIKGITTPLGRLVEGAEAVAGGDLTKRIDIKGGNELGKLASSFNKMMTALRERDEEIRLNHEALEKNFLELERSHTEIDEAYKKLSITAKELREYETVLEDRVRERTSELEEANRRLTESYKKIKEVDRLKSEFLTNMSHELRTPLNSIIGFSRVIIKEIDGPVTDIQRKDLDAIYNSGQHLLGLINDVLDLSKIEAGKLELSREKIDIRELMNDIVVSFNTILEDKGLKIDLHLVRGKGAVINADRKRIRQVLLNIINNAIKFTARGAIRITVKNRRRKDMKAIEEKPSGYCPKRMGGSKEEEIVLFSIKDSGTGIKAEDMHKVFETFQQIDSSSTRQEGGTGLGMSITQHLVEMHGGEIWLESVVGLGSIFHFFIPVQEAGTVKEEEVEADTVSLVNVG